MYFGCTYALCTLNMCQEIYNRLVHIIELCNECKWKRAVGLVRWQNANKKLHIWHVASISSHIFLLRFLINIHAYMHVLIFITVRLRNERKNCIMILNDSTYVINFLLCFILYCDACSWHHAEVKYIRCQ